MNIRSANLSDIPSLVNCWQEIDRFPNAQRPFGGDSADKPEHAQRLLEHTLQSKNATVLTAVTDSSESSIEKIIGTISGHVFDKPAVNLTKVGVIYGLWVDENYRQQGIGQALLLALETALQASGAQALQVGWDSPNALAAAWWEKRGYSAYEVIASKNI